MGPSFKMLAQLHLQGI